MRNNDFKDVVFNRHSIKEFDENFKISKAEMLEMLNEACLAPSSVNMQPWRFVVVESKEGKELLRPLVKFNTRQNDTSSAMIVIFGDLKCHRKANQILDESIKRGYMNEDVKKYVKDVFVPFYENVSEKKMNDIVKIDSSLFAMQFMLVARHHGYDTNAIGGFDEENIAEALGLDSSYVPVMIIAIGKANYKIHKSLRLDAKELSKFI